MRSCGGCSPSISKLERESFSSRNDAARASTSAGTSATAPRARSARLRSVEARSVFVRKIIGQKEGLFEQPLVQKPDPPGISARRCRPDDGLDGRGSRRLKQRFEDEQVHALIFEGKGEVSVEIIR